MKKINDITTKKKILHVIDSLGVGGAEVMLLSTIKELKEYDHLVVFLNESEDHQHEFSQHAKVLKVNFKSWLLVFFNALKLRKIIRQYKVAIVHAHLWRSVMLTRIALPGNIPFAFTIHSLLREDPFKKNSISLWMERLLSNKREFIISVSKTALDDYAAIVSIKSNVSFIVHNHVSNRFFTASPILQNQEEELKLVTVGNLKHAKNYFFLLEALSTIKDFSFELDIYGSGPLERELSDIIRSKKINVRLMGTHQEIDSVLPHYDLFIMASSHEGFGIALAEAMACQLPVLISDIPVFHEVAGDTAFYFSLANSNDFVKKLSHLNMLKREGKLLEIGVQCRNRVKEIASEEIYFNNIRSIYNQLTQEIK